MRYFEGVAITSRREGKNGVLETMDLESAGVDLVESKVVKAEGYDGDFMRIRSGSSACRSATSARRRSCCAMATSRQPTTASR
jgi:hypothetical protein